MSDFDNSAEIFSKFELIPKPESIIISTPIAQQENPSEKLTDEQQTVSDFIIPGLG